MQITTFQTLASEHGAKTSFAASRSSDKNGALSSDEEDSDGDRFGKPAKKAVKKPAKKVGGASALFGVKWLRIVIGESNPAAGGTLNPDLHLPQTRRRTSKTEIPKPRKRRSLCKPNTGGA
jgi:hypothetical protein